MRKKIYFLTAFCLLGASASVNADSDINYGFESGMPKGGFFVGLGGSYNSVKIDQHLSTKASFEVSRNCQPIASGFVCGKANPKRLTKTTFAPVFQLGYASQFECSEWAWGAKFAYKYLGLAFTNDKFDCWKPCNLSQNCGKKESFIGDSRIGSVQTRVNHQMDFRVFLAHTINCGNVYFGVGPVLFGAKHKVYRACGNIASNRIDNFADNHSNFSKTKWMWGGAAQVGIAFNLSCDWVLDVAYDYAVSGTYTNKHCKAFKGSRGSFSHVAKVFAKTSQQITSQSFTVALNKGF